jgi:hypothetical protein
LNVCNAGRWSSHFVGCAMFSRGHSSQYQSLALGSVVCIAALRNERCWHGHGLGDAYVSIVFHQNAVDEVTFEA